MQRKWRRRKKEERRGRINKKRSIINKKKIICHRVDLSVPANHWVKVKVGEKLDKYLDLARELKNLCNMKVTVITVITWALRTPRYLKKESMNFGLEEEVKQFRPYHYWNLQWYFEGSWRHEEICCHSDSSEKPSFRVVAENSLEEEEEVEKGEEQQHLSFIFFIWLNSLGFLFSSWEILSHFIKVVGVLSKFKLFFLIQFIIEITHEIKNNINNNKEVK